MRTVVAVMLCVDKPKKKIPKEQLLFYIIIPDHYFDNTYYLL